MFDSIKLLDGFVGSKFWNRESPHLARPSMTMFVYNSDDFERERRLVTPYVIAL